MALFSDQLSLFNLILEVQRMRNVLSRKSGKQKYKVCKKGVVHLLTANGRHKSYRIERLSVKSGNCVLFKKAYWERQNRDTQLSISVVSWKFCHKHTRLNTCLPLCKTKQKRNKTTTNKIHALRHRQLSGFQCVPPQYDCIVSPCPTQVPLQCLPLLGQFYKDPWFCLLSAQNFSNKISPVACLCSS